MTTFPDNAILLVTGASGFIGSHVIDVLLSYSKAQGKQYRVRGTVRGNKPWVSEYFTGKYGPDVYESVTVPDFYSSSNAFSSALEGVEGVIHVAGDVSMNTDVDHVIDGTKKATVSILEAAAKAGVKRFVLTSSSTSALVGVPDTPGTIVTSKSWNDQALAAAYSGEVPPGYGIPGYVVYSAAKMVGERAAWEWHLENNSPFVLNTILPETTWGSVLMPDEQSASTAGFIRSLWKGQDFGLHILQPQHYVNVGDVARLHVAALLDPAIQGERLFGYAHPWSWPEVLGILKKLHPTREFPQAVHRGRDLKEVTGRARSEEVLKGFFGQPSWIGLEQTLEEMTSDLD